MIVLPEKPVRRLVVRLGHCHVVSALGRGEIAEPGDVGHQVAVSVHHEVHRDAVQARGDEGTDGVAATVVRQGYGWRLAVVVLGQDADQVIPG